MMAVFSWSGEITHASTRRQNVPYPKRLSTVIMYKYMMTIPPDLISAPAPRGLTPLAGASWIHRPRAHARTMPII
mgnify:CR=1 FL=1